MRRKWGMTIDNLFSVDLVTPDGHPFVAIGVNHVGAISHHGEGEPDLFETKYGGRWDRLREDLLEQYRNWGLNAIGDAPEEVRRGIPHFVSCTLASPMR